MCVCVCVCACERFGQRVIGISGSLIWSNTMIELIFNPCGEYGWRLGGPVSQIHSPPLHAGASRIFSDLLMSVQMLNRERVLKETGSYRTYSIPGKIQPWFLNLWGKTCRRQKNAAWVPALAVKDLPLSRTLWWYIYTYICVCVCVCVNVLTIDKLWLAYTINIILLVFYIIRVSFYYYYYQHYYCWFLL